MVATLYDGGLGKRPPSSLYSKKAVGDGVGGVRNFHPLEKILDHRL